MDKLRAAILGYGRSGGSMHAGAMEAGEDFEVVAACDVDRDRLEAAKGRFGCSLYEDYRRMLEAERLDLVVIVTRSDQHCDMTCDCLSAGVNVLVTKPWARNEAEARRMVEAAERSGKLLLPWLPSRWGADLRRIREIISAGTIGKVFHVRRVQSSFARRRDWQTERRYGGGYLLNWGPHIVDTAVQAVGGGVRTAYGFMKHLINPGDAEDMFFAALTLEGGTLVTAEYTVAAEPPPTWTVHGQAGTIVVRGRELTVHAGEPPWPADPTKYGDMSGGRIEVTTETIDGELFGDAGRIYTEAAAAVRGEAAFAVSPADALELTRVLDAIRASDRERRVVEL